MGSVSLLFWFSPPIRTYEAIPDYNFLWIHVHNRAWNGYFRHCSVKKARFRGNTNQHTKVKMKFNEIKNKILRGEIKIRWDLTPQDTGQSFEITSQEDFERMMDEMKRKAGWYFYVDVWNLSASLHIAHNTENGSGESYYVEDSPVPEELLEKAVYDAGGALNMSGWYPINEEIREVLKKSLKLEVPSDFANFASPALVFGIPNKWGSSLKLAIREAAKHTPEYFFPIDFPFSGKSESGEEIPVNTLGRWVFGVPGFAGHLVFEGGTEDKIVIHYPEGTPEEAKTMIRKAVENLQKR